MTTDHRKPRAIRIDPEPQKARAPAARKPRAATGAVIVESVPDEAANGWVDALTPPPPPPARGGLSWGALLLAGLGGLASLAIGLAIDRFVRELFARNDWLGWLALGLAAIAALALLGLLTREVVGLSRLRTIERLRERGAQASLTDDARLARAVAKELSGLYGARADTARGRELVAGHVAEVIDGRDLIALAERDLLAPLDIRAAAMVMAAAKRVSLVTAVSPRAAIDLAYVLLENFRLIRRLADLYGGRPATLGFLRLARNVLAHLAATGAIALGDSVVQQVIGQGLAARLSARLGEGVVNGLLTARIGIAAMDVCRPLPFLGQQRPGVSQFMAELVRFNAPADAVQGHGGTRTRAEDARTQRET